MRRKLMIGLSLFSGMLMSGVVGALAAEEHAFVLLRVVREIRVVPGDVVVFETVPIGEASKRKSGILKEASEAHTKWEADKLAAREKRPPEVYCDLEPEAVSVSLDAHLATEDEAVAKAKEATEAARHWAVIRFTNSAGVASTEVLEFAEIRGRFAALLQEYRQQKEGWDKRMQSARSARSIRSAAPMAPKALLMGDFATQAKAESAKK